MRFSIVTETYPPEINGVALTVRTLETGLRARGHAVDVVRPRQSATDTGAPHETLVRGKGIPGYPGLRFGLPSGSRLRQRWREARPDAIYVATEGPLGWSAVRAARALGIPAATGFHTRFDDYAGKYGAGFLTPLVFAWLRRFHNRGNATLVPTRQLADDLAGRGFARVELMRRAVDTARFDPGLRDASLREAWGVPDDGLAVIHVGRIAAEKNLDLVVAAFRRIQAQRPDARMVWVGEGPVRESLQRTHPDFVFAGLQLGESLARHYASADLFLFPSLTETFGNVTLEAMASGIATVAFDYGAAREHLRDAEHGACVPFGNEAGFLAAAQRLALDVPALRRMGEAARASIAHLSPASVIERFETLLSGLAGGHAPSLQASTRSS